MGEQGTQAARGSRGRRSGANGASRGRRGGTNGASRGSGLGLGLLVVLGVAALGLFLALRDDEAGLRAWWALRADLRAAEGRIDGLRAEVASLERDTGGLEADPFALERAIRERLELALPGETLLRLADAPR